MSIGINPNKKTYKRIGQGHIFAQFLTMMIRDKIMYHTTTSALSQLKQLCPNQSSIAVCLNQLRQAKIQFLNLGNIIICPQQRCILFFQQHHLMEIETFSA